MRLGNIRIRHHRTLPSHAQRPTPKVSHLGPLERKHAIITLLPRLGAPAPQRDPNRVSRPVDNGQLALLDLLLRRLGRDLREVAVVLDDAEDVDRGVLLLRAEIAEFDKVELDLRRRFLVLALSYRTRVSSCSLSAPSCERRRSELTSCTSVSFSNMISYSEERLENCFLAMLTRALEM